MPASQLIAQRLIGRMSFISFWRRLVASSIGLFCVAFASCDRATSSVAPEVTGGRAAQLGVPTDTPVELVGFRTVSDLPSDLAQFRTVFWDPQDTISLRQKIQDYPMNGLRILEIGTGTGLIALCCLEAGAAHVVATDINPSAIVNAVYNAELLGVEARFETRLVPKTSSAAFSVIAETEKFDLIVSNPPWEDGEPKEPQDYAFYDLGFTLLESLFSELQQHLSPGGRVWLAYGCVDAIRTAQQLAPQYGLELTILDDRELSDLDNLFLPGMLLEVIPQTSVK